MARTAPNIMDLVIALAGGAAGQGKISKNLFTTAAYCDLVKGSDHMSTPRCQH
jgi:uncharacterized membrane protein